MIRLRPYAPDLNPTEHVWSHVKRSLGNLTTHGIDDLSTIRKNRLKRLQYRPELTDAFFAHTGLTLDPDGPYGSNSSARWTRVGIWVNSPLGHTH